MKHLVMLLLCGLMLLGNTPAAGALEVTASGQMLFQFGFRSNYGGKNGAFQSEEADHFYARQRMRLKVDFIASEHLRGAIQLQFGKMDWGNGKQGAALDTTSASPTVRQAYIDWAWPESSLKTRMGLQLLALPSAVAGSPVFDAAVAAVVLNYEVDEQLNLSAFWARPDRSASLNGQDNYRDNDMDFFALSADWNTESLRLQPYLLYGRIGQYSGYWDRRASYGDLNPDTADDRHSNLYLGGLALTASPTDKLTLAFDGIYGLMKNEASDTTGGVDRFAGWFAAVRADYRLPFGTLGGIAWYASGDDADDADRADGGKFGRLPTIGQGNAGFKPARLSYCGAYSMGDDRLISTTGVGTWGAGLHLKDVSFMENLKHSLKFYYLQGTNDKDTQNRLNPFSTDLYLTEKDRGFEADLDSVWKLSNGLTLIIELGYVYMDWDNSYQARDYTANNVWNTQIGFEYRF